MSVENDSFEDGGTEQEKDSGRSITKRMFIRELAQATGLQLKVADHVYDEFIRILVEHLRAGDQVVLTGFGRFSWRWFRGRPSNLAGAKPKKVVDAFPVMQFRGTTLANRFVAAPEEEVQGRRVPGTRLRTDGTRATVSDETNKFDEDDQD